MNNPRLNPHSPLMQTFVAPYSLAECRQRLGQLDRQYNEPKSKIITRFWYVDRFMYHFEMICGYRTYITIYGYLKLLPDDRTEVGFYEVYSPNDDLPCGLAALFLLILLIPCTGQVWEGLCAVSFFGGMLLFFGSGEDRGFRVK